MSLSILDEIRAGKKLRKVPESEKNDRSTLDALRKPKPVAPTATSAPAGRPNAPITAAPTVASTVQPTAPMSMGDLFANGIPKLRSTGSRASVQLVSAQDSSLTSASTSVGYAKAAPPPPPPPPPPPVVPSMPPPTATISTPMESNARNGAMHPPPPPPPPPSTANKPQLNGTVLQGSKSGRVFITSSHDTSLVNTGTSVSSREVPIPISSSNTIVTVVNSSQPPPPVRRKSSTTNRSQRTGLPSTESGVGAERSMNAKPKVIRINSTTIPAPPAAPQPQVSNPSPAYYMSQSNSQRISYQHQHPPPPPPPPVPTVPSSATRPGPAVATMSAEFERRFRFLNDAELPPPPAPYKGPRTYRTAATRSVPHRPAPTAPAGHMQNY